MKIAIVAPSPVPFTIGGAENLHWGLLHHINQYTAHQAELIKLPSPELNLRDLVQSYRQFSQLDLSHFDMLISTKYPAWMTLHENHVCYMLHRLRGLYDTYYLCDEPEVHAGREPDIMHLQDFMNKNRGRRRALNEFFHRWDALCSQETAADPSIFCFPGPLAREIIHFLDGIGLSSRVIRKYAAISANVAGRQDYFPDQGQVQVIHPPSNLTGFRRGRNEYLFTVSRLDAPKRVGLLVEAMQKVTADITLKIAGSGPHEGRLRQMACGDSRVEFLGFVKDAELVNYYSNALAVLFVPRDEDYGLVTLEAMMCAKPVITVTDAGGPNEFVENGRTGFSPPPDPGAIAEKIDYFCQHPQETVEMGLRGRQRVKHITWSRTVAALLEGQASAGKVKSVAKPKRLKVKAARICVAVPFAVFPPRGGGQQRVFHLYRHLAAALACPIDLVTLDHCGQQPMKAEIAPGLREIRIPKSIEHERAEQRISDESGSLAVTDVALPELFHLTPAFRDALQRSSRQAAVVIASHPYCLPVIRAACPEKEIIYEAHNVEADLKENLLTATETGRRLLKQTIATERACCHTGCFVQVCSSQDAERLQARYALSADKIWIIPNGVDLESVPFCPYEERLAIKKRLGSGKAFVSLFTGSWHGPNVAAMEVVLDLAAKLPDLCFLVMGSVGLAIQDRRIPSNVGLLGVIDNETREVVLHSVDVALNPMESGSGTNLKMLEYAAAGVPILSTPHGARGLALADEQCIKMAELDDFSGVLRTMRDHHARLKPRILRARQCVVQHYDWVTISNRLALKLRRHTSWFSARKAEQNKP